MRSEFRQQSTRPFLSSCTTLSAAVCRPECRRALSQGNGGDSPTNPQKKRNPSADVNEFLTGGCKFSFPRVYSIQITKCLYFPV
jgi:hypothetical protein